MGLLSLIMPRLIIIWFVGNIDNCISVIILCIQDEFRKELGIWVAFDYPGMIIELNISIKGELTDEIYGK